MTKETNPQAFPSNQNSVGMTLRDYFAAAAMQGMLAIPDDNVVNAFDLAQTAYFMSDAMLKARQA